MQKAKWLSEEALQIAEERREAKSKGKGKRYIQLNAELQRKARRDKKVSSIVLISHANKVMLKILQARLQQYVTQEIPDVQAGFRKGKGTRDHISNICLISEKVRGF